MFKTFIISAILTSSISSAFASTTQLNCDDTVRDGGYQFVVQDFASPNPTVLIYTKSRSGTSLYGQQQLAPIANEGGFQVFFNRLGIRTKMWLSADAHAKFSFIHQGVGRVQVPENGELTCYEEEMK